MATAPEIRTPATSVPFNASAADPATQTAAGRIYAKTSGGVIVPYWIDDAGTVTAMLGGGSGTITSSSANQVAYFTAATTVAGNAGLTYDTSTLTVTQPAVATGTPAAAVIFTGAAHTTISIAEATDVNLNLARTVQFSNAGGTLALQRSTRIQGATYSAAAALTVTDLIGLEVNSPVVGTNITATRIAALRLAAADAGTTTVTDVMQTNHTTSGTAGVGFGTGWLCRQQNSVGNLTDAGRFSFRTSQANSSVEATYNTSFDVALRETGTGTLITYFTVNAKPTATIPLLALAGFSTTTGFGLLGDSSTSLSVCVGGSNLCYFSSTVGNALTFVTTAGVTFGTTGGITMGTGGSNIVLGTATGTKIGTGTTQKLAFWNSTPVVQPSGSAVTTSGFTANASANAVVAESTFTGGTGSTAYHISDIVFNLKSLGLIAA